MQSGIRIAVGGKGGVGKTTVCAILAQLLVEAGYDVLAVDADPDTNLCSAFGIGPEESPEPLIRMKQLIAERTAADQDNMGAYFRLNPRVGDLPQRYWYRIRGLKLLVLGGITRAGTGCACAEGAFLRAMLNHTILGRNEAVLVDLDAGLECMGRSSIQGIDVLVIVVEPGGRSIETALKIAKMARELGTKRVLAIVNKITESSQAATVGRRLAEIPVLANIRYDYAVQQADLKRSNVFYAGTQIVDELRCTLSALTDPAVANKER
ncbi:MAG: AAA family ATPase [Phycisphaerales bacterium]|nr:MAG: AAA family ATPase [Phycisphaerales bacterium]